MRYEGCIPAVVTPFTDDLEVDYGSYESLLNLFVKNGVKEVVVAGSTGEGVNLTDDEYRELISLTKNSGLRAMAAVNSSSTKQGIFISEVAREAGAASLLVTTPPYNKPTQEGIKSHVREIKKASGLDVIAYNIPGRCGVAMTPLTLNQLAAEGTIQGVKDATGSVDNALDILLNSPEDFSLLSGEDSLTLAILSCGGSGVISASANVLSKEFVSLCEAFHANNLEEARKIQLSVVPKVRSLFVESNPIPVKYVLWKMGLIASPKLRLPLIEASQEARVKLDAVFNLK